MGVLLIVFPRSLCFNSHGAPGTCIPSCGYNESVDREPQYLVANQMKYAAQSCPIGLSRRLECLGWGLTLHLRRRAAKTPPKFILNAPASEHIPILLVASVPAV